MGVPEEYRGLVERVWERDGGRCVVCGGIGVDCHHIVPRSQLPGEANEGLLWRAENMCMVCREHHESSLRGEFLGILSKRHGYVYLTSPWSNYVCGQ